MNQRLERIKSVLACPHCGAGLEFSEERAACRGCSNEYPIRNGKIYFVQPPQRTDELDRFKGRLKSLLGDWYYRIGIWLIAPTYPFNYAARIRRHLDPSRQIVVDLGCGNHRIDQDVITVDLFDYPAVDVVCDLDALPFQAGSIDGFVSRSVLEHVADPIGLIRQCRRCTRPGGMTIHLIPFLFPFHASPNDFHRYTHQGQQLLFQGWEIVEQTNATGPVTLALLCTIEFASTILSCGWNRLKVVTYLILCALLFPLKFLDFPFVNRKSFIGLAPSICLVGRKPLDARVSA